jgi:predicted metal-dependent hydrolase
LKNLAIGRESYSIRRATNHAPLPDAAAWHDCRMVEQMALPLEAATGSATSPRYMLRRSARARRLAVRIHHDGRVEVVAPRGVPETLIHGFVDRHRPWIERKLQSRPPPAPPQSFPPEFIDLKALGERYRLHLAGGRGRPGIAAAAPGVLSLGGNWGAAEPVVARRVMLQWLLGYSRDALEPRLHELAQRGGFRFSALQMRRQRTRWGSCSSRGVISLNVCGVFQSPEVLQYLMIHELAHTRHMNHSAAYWRTVAEQCADWRRLDRELSRGWQHVPRWVFAGAATHPGATA